MPKRLFDVDWKAVFFPGTPLLEIIVRGTVMYLALIALLRLVLKREAGAVAITDLLVVVLLAVAALIISRAHLGATFRGAWSTTDRH